MGYVHHHADTIHFGNNLFAEWAETLPSIKRIVGGITDLIVFPMC